MRTNIIIFVIVQLLLIETIDVFAQDVHFSQMEYTPLSLNPGLAGANAPMQGIVNYRSQWQAIGSPYKTIAASFDARFNEKKRSKNGIIAGGLNFYNDQAGDSKFQTTSINLHLAYHLLMTENSTLGVGICTGFNQSSIKASIGRWGSQYDGTAYNSTLQGGNSTIPNQSFSYFDAGTGVVYSYNKGVTGTTKNEFQCGLAAYHVNRPDYSFFGSNQDHLFIRWSSFVNAVFKIPNTKGAILPGVYAQFQGKSAEYLFGTYYRYAINEGTLYTGFNLPMNFSIGLFYRYGDALITKFMFEFDQYSCGISYDFNVSDLSIVSKTRGGMELFIRFNMNNGGGFRNRI